MKIRIAFSLLCTFLCSCLEARDVYYSQFNSQNGLPGNKVFDIYQDKKGFIWLGSEAGLIRFDHKVFKKYNAVNQSSLSVSNIKEDRLGRIWFMNFDGFVFYIENDEVKSLNNNPSNSYQPFALTDTRLFVFQYDGIYVFDIQSLKLKAIIKHNTSGIESSLVSIGQEVFFVQQQELYRIDSLLHISKERNGAKKSHNNAKLTSHNNRIFWASQFNTGKIIYEYSRQLELIRTHSIKEVEGVNEVNVVNQQLWISTNKGCFIYDYEGTILKFKENIFKDKAISKTTIDYQQNYWFSSLDNGILTVSDLSVNLINLENHYPNVFIYQNNKYLIGTKKGELFFLKDGTKQSINQFKGNPIIYYLNGFVNGDIFASGFGSYWIKNNNQPKYDFGFAIKDVWPIDEKYYAIATSGQLLLLKKLDVMAKSVWDVGFPILANERTYQMLELDANIRIKCVAYDSISKTIFYSGNTGLKFRSLNGVGNIYINSNEKFYANSMFIADQKLIALSTSGILYAIQKMGNKFHFTNINSKISGKPSVIKFAKYFKNYIYYLSDNGAYQLDLKSLKTTKIRISINANEVIDFCIKNDSIISFLTDKFIVEKNIEQAQLPLSIPTLFQLLGIKSNGKPKGLNTVHEFKFSENNIEIEFALLNFNRADAKSLYYQVNKGDWIQINSDLSALSFQNLNEGNYLINFRIDNQPVNESIEFRVLPPFYRTWWFYLLILLSITLFVYLIYYIRLRNIRKDMKLMSEKMKLEQELNNSIVTSIKSQMNPHFFYNALNTIQSFLYTDKKRDASNYLSKFSDLTRKILEMSDKDTIKLSEEIEAIRLYLDLEKMRFEDDFVYEISVHANVELDLINIPSMLIQPYIENAIKHGLLHKVGEKYLYIHFEKNEGFLKVDIKDNGVGRSNSERLKSLRQKNIKSYATQANQKRLELINKYNKNIKPVEIIDLYNDNQEPAGTQVVLYISTNNIK